MEVWNHLFQTEKGTKMPETAKISLFKVEITEKKLVFEEIVSDRQGKLDKVIDIPLEKLIWLKKTRDEYEKAMNYLDYLNKQTQEWDKKVLKVNITEEKTEEYYGC